MFDCHTHSKFSTDSLMDAVQACDAALKLGLDGITFTDHLDFDFPGHENEYIIDFNKYMEYMDKLKERYKSGLKVLKGIEIGIQPHVLEDILNVVRSFNFDFVLCSVHVVDRLDPYTDLYYAGKSKSKAYGSYLEEVLYAVTAFDDYDIAGHLDYVVRHAKYNDVALRYNEHADLFDMIFKALINRSKGFEINTGSYRRTKNGIPYPEYDISILKRYRELGGEIVTIGSDAHSLEYIGCRFEYFKNVIAKAGFKYIAHYENRKPVFELVR